MLRSGRGRSFRDSATGRAPGRELPARRRLLLHRKPNIFQPGRPGETGVRLPDAAREQLYAAQREDALPVQEAVLSMERRLGGSENEMLIAQSILRAR